MPLDSLEHFSRVAPRQVEATLRAQAAALAIRARRSASIKLVTVRDRLSSDDQLASDHSDPNDICDRLP